MASRQVHPLQLWGTGLITLAIWGILLSQHFDGGVPSHHPLNQPDIPAISSWWGGLLLPVLAWVLLGRIVTRSGVQKAEGTYAWRLPLGVTGGFSGALLFGVALSIIFFSGYEDATRYMTLALFPLAVVLPIYRAESILGLILGMSFFFGAILSMMFAFVLALIFALLFHLVRPVLVRGIRFVSGTRTNA